ncbi:MAG TPA: DUF4234 domain-containing protein [Stackebrandtia sp.]|jgi:hypothetical protein|uniref:DUF4234 domain-containing protein n=1 Tax=Stackebrandtia sp. TaxID=2023065 RepID=UPI002D3EA380|nr:DUF4234 domain-containing protein [Stackebrandtia sp.]HZE40465.1 DUF4234 domain-containing protein [Stackebrandtia sp.]
MAPGPSNPPPINLPDTAGYGQVAHPGSVRLGKTRSPFGVWLLALVTFGIYGLVWYYKVNRELRDYNGQIEVSPGLAVCNVSIFSPITIGISAIISFVCTGGRISDVAGHARVGSCSGIVGILLQAFLFGTGICYYQSVLNRVWAAHGQV